MPLSHSVKRTIAGLAATPLAVFAAAPAATAANPFQTEPIDDGVDITEYLCTPLDFDLSSDGIQLVTDADVSLETGALSGNVTAVLEADTGSITTDDVSDVGSGDITTMLGALNLTSVPIQNKDGYVTVYAFSSAAAGASTTDSSLEQDDVTSHQVGDPVTMSLEVTHYDLATGETEAEVYTSAEDVQLELEYDVSDETEVSATLQAEAEVEFVGTSANVDADASITVDEFSAEIETVL